MRNSEVGTAKNTALDGGERSLPDRRDRGTARHDAVQANGRRGEVETFTTAWLGPKDDRCDDLRARPECSGAYLIPDSHGLPSQT